MSPPLHGSKCRLRSDRGVAGRRMNLPTEPSRIRELEKRDLQEQLEARQAAVRRHTFWAVLGVSPGAAIPLLMTFGDVGVTAVLVGMAAMTGLEGWRALRARKDVTNLETQMHELSGTPPPEAEGEA